MSIADNHRAFTAHCRAAWRREITRARRFMSDVMGGNFDVHIDHDWTVSVFNEERAKHRRDAIVERNARWRTIRKMEIAQRKIVALSGAARSASR